MIPNTTRYINRLAHQFEAIHRLPFDSHARQMRGMVERGYMSAAEVIMSLATGLKRYQAEV